jgi:flagellin
MPAINANRYFGINNSNLSSSLEKLSSGYAINRAGDNAAGLAVSEKMRAQIGGLTQASKNAEDGISMIQTFEGALTETDAILQRMRSLAVQSANGTYDDQVDRAAIELEYTQLCNEVDDIAATDFNGVVALSGNSQTTITNLANSSTELNGSYTSTSGLNLVSSVKLQVGARTKDLKTYNFDYSYVYKHAVTAGSTVSANGAVAAGTATSAGIMKAALGDLKADLNCTSSGLGLRTKADSATSAVYNVSLSTQTSANAAIDQIDHAINKVSMIRATFGAIQNRLEHKIDNLNTTNENLTAAESRIRDTDMATEMMNFTKNQILSQASQSMLAQANTLPQGVLQLLQ